MRTVALACVSAVFVLGGVFFFRSPATASEGYDLIDPVDRPVDILPAKRTAAIIANMPPISDATLRDIIDSPDTMFYDHSTIIPGYQDSFGDDYFPIGFRPNTISPGLINGAVPGGHGRLFIRSGEFHFPFGRTGHMDDAKNTFVVDMWKLPREAGKLLPVVYWRKQPNNNTHRIEWMFPIGTVFGELIFITDSRNQSHIFEIRTRTRIATGWTVGVYRPFPTAEDLARALESKRSERPEWKSSKAIQALVEHLRNPSTLQSGSLASGTTFASSFSTATGAVDNLPAAPDEDLIIELLHETEFKDAKNVVWKQEGSLKAYAPSTKADFHIVPKNNSAAFFETNDAFCTRCHQDAGRPFKDYYYSVIAYGELWGEDDVFSWHPFESKNFVDSKGAVVNFNNDNRRFRQDFVDAGVVAPYNASVHLAARYQKLNRAWKSYKY